MTPSLISTSCCAIRAIPHACCRRMTAAITCIPTMPATGAMADAIDLSLFRTTTRIDLSAHCQTPEASPGFTRPGEATGVLLAQRFHRIDACSAPRGEIARDSGDTREPEHDRGERNRVRRCDVEQ